MTSIQDHLSACLATTTTVLDGIDSEQWRQPSTCDDWTVRQLVEHLVGGCALTAAVLAGQDATSRPEYADIPDDELAAALRGASDAIGEAVSTPGALEQIVRVGFGPVPGSVAARLCLVEAIVHGVDAARSTDQSVDFDTAAVEEALAFSEPMMGQLPPGRSPFKPSTPVADDAPALDRLLALLGR